MLKQKLNHYLIRTETNLGKSRLNLIMLSLVQLLNLIQTIIALSQHCTLYTLTSMKEEKSLRKTYSLKRLN